MEGLTGNFYGLDDTGATNFVLSGDSYSAIMTSPALGQTELYFGYSHDIGLGNAVLYSLNLTNLTLKGVATNTYAIVSSPLICPDGSVVFGAEDGWLYCYWGSSLPAGTNAPWPTFHANAQRTGLQAGTATLVTNNNIPFVCDGTNNGSGHFSFAIVGTNNGPWTVYSSTNLSNWVSFQTGVNLSGTPPTNLITDTGVLNVSNKFYQLSNSLGMSKIIGFVGLTIQTGTNIIADQLYQVDDGVMRADNQSGLGTPMNTLSGLFNLYPWAYTSLGDTEFFKWNGSGFDQDVNYAGKGSFPEWLNYGDITILPGMPVIMNNQTGTSYKIWFMGLVRNQQIFSLQPGTNYLSATVPIGGYPTTITGYTSHAGDVIETWNTTSHIFVAHTNVSGTWSNGGPPELAVGQGFVLISTNSYVWTNSWP